MEQISVGLLRFARNICYKITSRGFFIRVAKKHYILVIKKTICNTPILKALQLVTVIPLKYRVW